MREKLPSMQCVNNSYVPSSLVGDELMKYLKADLCFKALSQQYSIFKVLIFPGEILILSRNFLEQDIFLWRS